MHLSILYFIFHFLTKKEIRIAQVLPRPGVQTDYSMDEMVILIVAICGVTTGLNSLKMKRVRGSQCKHKDTAF